MQFEVFMRLSEIMEVLGRGNMHMRLNEIGDGKGWGGEFAV